MSDPAAEVLAVVHKFMACIKAKDRETMFSLILPTGYGTIVRNNQPQTMSLVSILNRIPWDSPVDGDEVTFNEIVHVDHDLAVAWTPYKVHFGGVFHHEGTNIISLWKSEKGWIITGVADNSRTPDGRKYEQPGV